MPCLVIADFGTVTSVLLSRIDTPRSLDNLSRFANVKRQSQKTHKCKRSSQIIQETTLIAKELYLSMQHQAASADNMLYTAVGY